MKKKVFRERYNIVEEPKKEVKETKEVKKPTKKKEAK